MSSQPVRGDGVGEFYPDKEIGGRTRLRECTVDVGGWSTEMEEMGPLTA